MEVTQGTTSDESPFNAHAQRHGWKVKKRMKIGWMVKRRRKIAARDHRISLAFFKSEARGQKLISPPPLIQFMKYVVPIVLVLVTLKYQAKTESLFRENPAAVWCFIAATCVYWLIVGAMKQMPTTLNCMSFQIYSRAALASGYLSVVSVASILLSYPISLIPIIIWTPLLVVLAWPIPYLAYSLLHMGITGVINKIYALVVWARGLKLTEEASLPV